METLRVKVLGSCILEWEMSWKGGLIFGRGARSLANVARRKPLLIRDRGDYRNKCVLSLHN